MQKIAHHNITIMRKNTTNNLLHQAKDNMVIKTNNFNNSLCSVFNKVKQYNINASINAQHSGIRFHFCKIAAISSDKNPLNHVNKRLLIVEDDCINQKIISLFLKELNYESIDLAGTGQQAISLLNFYDYDLVLLDIGLPDINGIELCKQIRQLSCCNQTPIIALTAFTNEEINRQCLSAGINNVLHKPINLDELNNTLTYWLSL
jgi:CheY-like chemotaxis protein